MTLSIRQVSIYDPFLQQARGLALPVIPDWTSYNVLWDNGSLVILGVFDGDLLVGFSFLLGTVNLAKRNEMIVTVPLFFIKEECRNAATWKALLAKGEEIAKKGGASRIVIQSPQEYVPLLLDQGYPVLESVCVKEL